MGRDQTRTGELTSRQRPLASLAELSSLPRAQSDTTGTQGHSETSRVRGRPGRCPLPLPRGVCWTHFLPLPVSGAGGRALPRTPGRRQPLAFPLALPAPNRSERPELEEAVSEVAQSCPTPCHPSDSTVHGILQARILEWAAYLFSRGSSQSRNRTQVSRIAGRFFTS